MSADPRGRAGSLQQEVSWRIGDALEAIANLHPVDRAALSIAAAAAVKAYILESEEFRTRLAGALIARSDDEYARGYAREPLNEYLADREAVAILSKLAEAATR